MQLAASAPRLSCAQGGIRSGNHVGVSARHKGQPQCQDVEALCCKRRASLGKTPSSNGYETFTPPRRHWPRPSDSHPVPNYNLHDLQSAELPLQAVPCSRFDPCASKSPSVECAWSCCFSECRSCFPMIRMQDRGKGKDCIVDWECRRSLLFWPAVASSWTKWQTEPHKIAG